MCVAVSRCVRSGKSTFVTFKCTKALPRHHYAFNLTVQQSVCCSSSVVTLPPQPSTSVSSLTVPTLCTHLSFSFKTELKPPETELTASCVLHLGLGVRLTDLRFSWTTNAFTLYRTDKRCVVKRLSLVRSIHPTVWSFTPVKTQHTPRDRAKSQVIDVRDRQTWSFGFLSLLKFLLFAPLLLLAKTALCHLAAIPSESQRQPIVEQLARLLWDQ